MTNNNSSATTAVDAKGIVLSCVKALNEENFEAARKYVKDDFTFAGVLGSRNGAEEYFRDMQHMKLKYRIKKSFADEDDVCLLYDLTMSGVTIFGCGWYHLQEGKISSLKVVFDPRPMLEHKS
jgi:hypothetical protein